MRIILTFCFCLTCLLYPAKSIAQGIGQVRVQYANLGVSNDLEVIAEVLIPSQPAHRMNYTARVSNDTLYLVACYYAGIASAPTTITDILPLGPVNPNLSTLHFKIFTSLSNTQCSFTGSATKIQAFQISAPLGIKTNNEKSEILLYPNPATDFLFVKNQNFQRIILRDLTGKILLKKSFQPEQDLQLDLSTLNKGVYLAELISENGKSRFIRILKE